MERIALISDVHGNLTALEAVLADIERRGITGSSTSATTSARARAVARSSSCAGSGARSTCWATGTTSCPTPTASSTARRCVVARRSSGPGQGEWLRGLAVQPRLLAERSPGPAVPRERRRRCTGGCATSARRRSSTALFTNTAGHRRRPGAGRGRVRRHPRPVLRAPARGPHAASTPAASATAWATRRRSTASSRASSTPRSRRRGRSPSSACPTTSRPSSRTPATLGRAASTPATSAELRLGLYRGRARRVRGRASSRWTRYYHLPRPPA